MTCTISQRVKDRDGYSKIWIKGKEWREHRYVWTQHNGDIPKGKVIRHLCNNPSCINIEHLAIGTHYDNMQDRKKAGHYNKGTKHVNAKLTEEQVLDIRTKQKTQLEYAEQYAVSRFTIQQIQYKNIWKHI